MALCSHPPVGALLTEHLTTFGHEVDAVDLVSVDADEPAAAYGHAASGQVRAGSADIVVAHSGAGLLLPAIASSLSAKAQVNLAALIPDGTRSFVDELTDDDDAAAVVHDEWVGVDPTTGHDAARRFLFHDCDDDTTAWALTTLRRFAPTTVYAEVVTPVDIAAVAIVPENIERSAPPGWPQQHEIGLASRR